jgi:hypothetical protein
MKKEVEDGTGFRQPPNSFFIFNFQFSISYVSNTVGGRSALRSSS